MKRIIHHVKKIRQQPEHIRRSILHITTGIFAIILFFLWIYSLGAGAGSEEAKAKINQDIKPFSVIKDNITNQYNSISNPDLNIDSNALDGQAQ
ncbi:MAG: hypothetical protein WC609_02350 [Candidatus Paceibacterota bacterium]|jgi:hypothetical protein